MGSAREVVSAAVARLTDAGVPRETRVAAVRGPFGRTRLRPVGEVWRLGALCLASDCALFATGEVIVVTEPTHPNFRNELAVRRNELRAQLRGAGIPVGATVVVDARPLDLDAAEPPLIPLAGGLGVLWTAGGEPIPLERYLRERVDLVVGPPAP
jgi:hypothetical protein